MSHTNIGNSTFTQIVLAWDSAIVKSVQKVAIGCSWDVLRNVATFALSVELVFAMYGRYTATKQTNQNQIYTNTNVQQ